MRLLNLDEELQNVSQACKLMDFSRDTFYRYRDAVDAGGVESLLEQSRRKPNRKNRVDPQVENTVLNHALQEASHGQARASNELRKAGIYVSPAEVRSIWRRHDLARFNDRLHSLEEHVAKTGEVLTDSFHSMGT